MSRKKLTKAAASWRLDLKTLRFIPTHWIPWIIWSIVGFYYLFDVVLRVMPSSMAPEIMSSFHMNASQFGLFTSMYYVSYVVMQIPAGLIVDRFSIRKSLFTAALMCLGGLLIVHSTTIMSVAYFGRFIIGLGSSFAYVYTLKVATIWLPKRHFGMATCIADSLAMLGMIVVDVVFVRVSQSAGMWVSILSLVITGVIAALLIFFVFRDKTSSKHEQALNREDTRDLRHILSKLAKIVKKPQVWLIGVVGCLTYLPASVIGDTWGIPFLQSVYHLSREGAGNVVSALSFGWILAGPFVGAWSDRTRQRVLPMKLTVGFCALFMALIVLLPLVSSVLLPNAVVMFLFFMVGVTTGSHPLVFAMARENFDDRIAGTVVAVVNTLTMLGGWVFQPLIGFVMDRMCCNAQASSILASYTARDFSYALSIVPLGLLLCFILIFFIKETGNKIAYDT